MLVIKIIGLAILFFTATALGFFVAHKGEAELKNLNYFIVKITELRDRILYDGSEIEILINKIFTDAPLLKSENGRATVAENLVGKEEKKILDEFFGSLGTTERQGEISRAEFCILTLSESSKRISLQTREKSHLYKILGVCSGILVCILFI